VAAAGAKRVLFVAWRFPPHTGPVAANALGAVNALARRGHTVTVLTMGAGPLGPDSGAAGGTDPAVTVVRVDQPAAWREPIVNRWSDLLLRYGGAAPQWLREVDARVFPEPTEDHWPAAWLPGASAAARTLHDARPFDLVVAVLPPAVSAGVALSLNAARAVPFVLYEPYPWEGGILSGPAGQDALGAPNALFEQILDRASQTFDAAFGQLEESPGW
jgi:hypothetical protein